MIGVGRALPEPADPGAPRPGAVFGLAFAAVAVSALLGAGFAEAALPQLSSRGQELAVAALAVVAAQLGFPLRALVPGHAARDLLAWPVAVGLGTAAGLALCAVHYGRPAVQVLALAAGAAVLGAFLESLSRLLLDAGLRAPAATGACALLLAAAGLAPVWLGPLAELLATQTPVASAVVGVSPLSYLAAMAHHDYLREQWFYAHSSLGSLRFDYPEPLRATGAWLLATACLALVRVRRWKHVHRT